MKLYFSCAPNVLIVLTDDMGFWHSRAFGARLMPRDAYRFARGEEVTSSTGQPAELSRPLDWLVVSDHSDGFGFSLGS